MTEIPEYACHPSCKTCNGPKDSNKLNLFIIYINIYLN